MKAQLDDLRREVGESMEGVVKTHALLCPYGETIARAMDKVRVENTAEQQRTPRKVNAHALGPKRRRGYPGLNVATIGVRAYQQEGTQATQLDILFPREAANRAGLVVGERARFTVVGRTLVIEPSHEGVKISSRSESSAARIAPGGAQLCLREPHPSTQCTWHLDQAHCLVIDLPDWWPKGAPGPKPGGRRAHSAAPAAPPVSDAEEASPPRTAVTRPHASPAALVPGGELIAPEDREFHCHTCQRAIATVQCTHAGCDGLYCPSCWQSHELTHRH